MLYNLRPTTQSINIQSLASKLAEGRKPSSNINLGKGKTKKKDGNRKQKMVGRSAKTPEITTHFSVTLYKGNIFNKTVKKGWKEKERMHQENLIETIRTANSIKGRQNRI